MNAAASVSEKRIVSHKCLRYSNLCRTVDDISVVNMAGVLCFRATRVRFRVNGVSWVSVRVSISARVRVCVPGPD